MASTMKQMAVKTLSKRNGRGYKISGLEKTAEKSAKTAKIVLDEGILFLYNLMRMFFSMHTLVSLREF